MEENTTPVPASTPTSTETPKPKKNKTVVIILIILLALLFLCGLCGVGGYFLYKNYLVEEYDDVDISDELDDLVEDYSEGEDLECDTLWWFDDSSTECGLDEFCGLYMYESLQTFETQEACESALTDEGGETIQTGAISGSVGYPSEYIPTDMEVCAVNIDTSEEYCETIVAGDEYTNGYGYIVEVPFGTYNVYAQVPGDSYQSYYSEYVTCGMSVDCSSHDPIDVVVDSEDTGVTGIDPTDWYNF